VPFYFSLAIYFVVLGGNSRLSYLLGCGERSFFDQNPITDIEPHYGIEPTMRFFLSLTLYMEVSLVMLATLDLATLDVTARADAGCHTALGVFFRFQVSDFDCLLGFFSLCHFIFLAICLGYFSLVLCQ
jgi:hypothetical protein